MKQTNLIFLLNSNNQILLGMKKRGFGVNKWNGFGGKCNENETILQSVIRELEEEASIKIDANNVEETGLITFVFPHKPERDQECSIFRAKYDGDFKESEEMLPKWRNISEIPYDQMREDDKYRLPRLIAGEKFNITFHLDEDGKLLPTV